MEISQRVCPRSGKPRRRSVRDRYAMLHLHQTAGHKQQPNILIFPPIVGQRGTLGIILRSYDPSNIKCGIRQQRYVDGEDCKRLLGLIPAEVAPPILWGPSGALGVDKFLPYSWQLPREFLLCFLYLICPTPDTSLQVHSKMRTLNESYCRVPM